MRNYLILIAFFICSVGPLASQNISGQVVDENDLPLAFANVVLLTLTIQRWWVET